MPLEQLGVKYLAQGHIGVSQWIRIWVSHTKGMCLIHCPITTPFEVDIKTNKKKTKNPDFQIEFDTTGNTVMIQ